MHKVIGFCFNSTAAGGGHMVCSTIQCSMLRLVEPFTVPGSDRSIIVTSADYCNKTST